jgi:ascorbate PTS system EIIA or EIIAB component
MELPALPDDAVELGAPAADWRAAIELAGSVLTRIGAARPAYTEAMIRMVEDRGPYIVIAPGLALAHARSGKDVQADGLAVVTLAEPVPFGHPHNDPVRVVLALSAASPERHLPMLAAVANAFNARGAVERIADASSADAVREALGVSAG